MVINQSSNLSNIMNERIIKIIASIGLITGGLLGLAGSFAPTDLLRYIAWNIDGVGLESRVKNICTRGTLVHEIE